MKSINWYLASMLVLGFAIAGTRLHADCNPGVGGDSTCAQGCEITSTWYSSSQAQSWSHAVAWNLCGLWADPSKNPSSVTNNVTEFFYDYGYPICSSPAALSDGIIAGDQVAHVNTTWSFDCVSGQGL